jgi:hypothetical protein
MDFLYSITASVVTLAVAFALFVRAHNHPYPSNRSVKHWTKGSFSK